ncbi:Retrotransposon gag domain - like 5 [Theobroma cacao]|nr:Retrotransposon gag domain - like 5 [Theobroma cacao]
MANQQEEETKPLRDYVVPQVQNLHSSIQRPPIQANNFEIKLSIIQMIQTAVQFGGLPNDDPNAHIINFLKIYDTFKANGAANDAIRLRLFPFSLRDKAKSWLNSLPTSSINTWDDLAKKFLAKFFPPTKSTKMWNDITAFMQFDFESLYEAWERYKDLMRRCPHHGLPKWLQVQTFYNGLLGPFRTTIDSATKGALMSKSIDEAYDLLKEIASNNYQWPSERLGTRKITRIHELDVINIVSTQLASLAKKIDKLSVNVVQNSFMTCEFSGEGHSNDNYPIYSESCQFVGNRQQNNRYSNTYNPGWRNHPNFSLNNNQWSSSTAKSNFPPGFPSKALMLEKKPSMEDMFMQFMTKTDAFTTKTDAFITKTDAFMIRIDASIQNQAASVRNLEIQAGQLASALNTKPQVEHLYIPVDFIVVKIEDDFEIPLILGRLFLATVEAIIDVKNGKITFRVGEEQVVFNLFNATQYPYTDSCYKVDSVNEGKGNPISPPSTT